MLLIAVAGAALWTMFPAAGGRSTFVVPARHVVLAELFTSEGCSSCPPADALLQEMNGASPVPGVEVLGLEEHVDYWDHLGWRDPFSSSAFTRRQSLYASSIFPDQIYTPQLVVDGAFQAIGSDRGGIRDAIKQAASRPGADLRVTATSSGNRAHVEVHVDVPRGVDRRKDADLMVAVVEDGLTSRVDRGENGGRTLTHAAVVRSMKTIGAVARTALAGDASAEIPLDGAWQARRLRIIAFVQERSTLRVLGTGAASLGASGSGP